MKCPLCFEIYYHRHYYYFIIIVIIIIIIIFYILLLVTVELFRIRWSLAPLAAFYQTTEPCPCDQTGWLNE